MNLSMVLLAIITGGGLIFWLGCAVVVAWDRLDRLRGRTMTLAMVCGRATHPFVPLLQAVFVGSVGLISLPLPWWVGVAGSAAILLLWLLDRLGFFDEWELWRKRAERVFMALMRRCPRRARSPRTAVWSPVRYGAVADAGEAIAWVLATFVEELPLDFRLDGDRSLAMWWGPCTAGTHGQFGPLRVDLDFNLGRAVVQWSPDLEYGLEPGAPPCATGRSAASSAPAGTGQRTSTPPSPPDTDTARVTPGRALEAIAEYVSTASKPSCLIWNPTQRRDDRRHHDEARTS
jgi:hypothetical protein